MLSYLLLLSIVILLTSCYFFMSREHSMVTCCRILMCCYSSFVHRLLYFRWLYIDWVVCVSVCTEYRLQCITNVWSWKSSGEQGRSYKASWPAETELFCIRVWEVFWILRHWDRFFRGHTVVVYRTVPYRIVLSLYIKRGKVSVRPQSFS